MVRCALSAGSSGLILQTGHDFWFLIETMIIYTETVTVLVY
jgi:hypothetical protein